MASGYRGVLKDSNTTTGLKKMYRVQVRRNGKRITLGRFGNAAEAALCYVRSPEGKREAASATTRSRQMTAVEAMEEAALDGTKLLPSNDNTSGFKNVGYDNGKFKAYVRRGGRQVHLGRFSTPEEAALCFARSAEGNQAVGRPLVGPPADALTAAAGSAFAAAVNASTAGTTRPQMKKRRWRRPFGASRGRPKPATCETRAREYTQGDDVEFDSRTVAGELIVDKHDKCLAEPALCTPAAPGNQFNWCPVIDTDVLRVVRSMHSPSDFVYSSSASSSRPSSPFTVLRTECEAIGEDCAMRAAWFVSFGV